MSEYGPYKPNHSILLYTAKLWCGKVLKQARADCAFTCSHLPLLHRVKQEATGVLCEVEQSPHELIRHPTWEGQIIRFLSVNNSSKYITLNAKFVINHMYIYYAKVCKYLHEHPRGGPRFI